MYLRKRFTPLSYPSGIAFQQGTVDFFVRTHVQRTDPDIYDKTEANLSKIQFIISLLVEDNKNAICSKARHSTVL